MFIEVNSPELSMDFRITSVSSVIFAMDKQTASLEEECEKLEDMCKEMEENHIAGIRERCKEIRKMCCDISLSMQSIELEIKNGIRKLDNQKATERKDGNSKLSDYVQRIIQTTQGPLKPQDLHKILLQRDFNQQRRNILKVVKKYSSDTLEVRKQLLDVIKFVKKDMKHRKKQAMLHSNCVRKIKKLEKKEKQEHIIIITSNKVQRNLNEKETSLKKQAGDSKKKKRNVKIQVNGKSDTGKQQMSKNQTGKDSRKRQVVYDTDSCSSQDSCEVMKLARKMRKHFKIDSSAENGWTSEDSTENILVCDSRRKVPVRKTTGKLSKTPSEGLGEEESISSENELTVSEKPFAM